MIKNLNGKNILLGVTGGISAYKSCELSRLLIKDGADVNVVMTSNAEKFVSALTFQYLTGNKVSNDMYDVSDPKISHIDLADKADLIIICPATANFISKFANGIADNLLLNILLATKVQIIVCPAMNVNMYENKIIQENITRLKKNGVIFIEPETGELACGWEGKGRLAEIENILKFIKKKLQNKTLINENILITAGATREYLDAVRFISNPSKSVLVIILNTPATASEPYTVEPPFLSNSIRFRAIDGKLPISTGDSAELVATAVSTILLPFIRTRVLATPRPLMFTFLIPVIVPPSTNCSDVFTVPDTAVRFLTKSDISGCPADSKSSRL